MNRGRNDHTYRSRFEIANWDETPFDDGVGVSKLTEALVAKKYSGDIDGTSTTKWLMAYAPDKTATYVGIERIKGTVGGKRGSLCYARRRLRGRGRHGNAARRVRHRRAAGARAAGKFRADPAGSSRSTSTASDR